MHKNALIAASFCVGFITSDIVKTRRLRKAFVPLQKSITDLEAENTVLKRVVNGLWTGTWRPETDAEAREQIEFAIIAAHYEK